MIKYDVAQKRWINTEDPTWILETKRNEVHFRDFPDEFLAGEEPTEFFGTLEEFFDWRNGHSLKYTSIACIIAKFEEDGTIYPFYWQINLHPLITPKEFSWGVRIAEKFVYWYYAHQYAQEVDTYMDVVFEEARDIWESMHEK